MQTSKYEKLFNMDLLEGAKFAGKYEFPVIEKVNLVPNGLVSFEQITTSKAYDDWVHFFIDDWKFSKLFRQPFRYLHILRKFDGVIAPDNSILWNAPYFKQIESIGNSRMMGSWLQRAGLNVIPCVRWGKKETYDFAFDGLQPEGTVAVGTHGAVRCNETRKIFSEGVPELVHRILPRTIIVYGSFKESMFEAALEEDIKIVNFDSQTAIAMRERKNGID